MTFRFFISKICSKNARTAAVTGVFSIVFLCAVCSAAPSLQINKGPVLPIPSYTGPTNDQDAVSGQWFVRLDNGSNVWRTHEFYDNVNPDYGGGYLSHKAIYGRIANLVFDVNSAIIGFDIIATVSNDVPALSPWRDGTNSHSETLSTPLQHDQVLYGVKLCAEFAISDLNNLQQPWFPPYLDHSLYIIATNEDLLAWYCWTPGNQPNKNPDGAYFVPAWDFGDIPPGQGATRRLSFIIDDPGTSPGENLHNTLIESEASSIDVLVNRTTSLKISHWIDEFSQDIPILYGVYPEFPYGGSSCSVFHNIPEPTCTASFVLLLLLKKTIQ
jgi:hypothetical protein